MTDSGSLRKTERMFGEAFVVRSDPERAARTPKVATGNKKVTMSPRDRPTRILLMRAMVLRMDD